MSEMTAAELIALKDNNEMWNNPFIYLIWMSMFRNGWGGNEAQGAMTRAELYDGLNFQIALNYGSRDEMMRAMKAMIGDVQEGKLSIEALNEELFATYLDTKDIPDPDLMIRTSGEQRLSNYLLWQLAYSEFYFTDVLWPDFSREDLIDAIEYFNGRDRRFGGVKEGV